MRLPVVKAKNLLGGVWGNRDTEASVGAAVAVQSVKHTEEREILSSGELSTPAVEREVDVIWSYVSISREQFSTHYIEFAQRILEYVQDESILIDGLKAAREKLAASMITRLPHDRCREEGHKHEQLWKWAVYCQSLIAATKACDIVFIDQESTPRISIKDRVAIRRDTEAVDAIYFSEHRLIVNFDYLFNETSRQWLSFDKGRPLVAIIEAIMTVGNKRKASVNDDPVTQETSPKKERESEDTSVEKADSAMPHNTVNTQHNRKPVKEEDAVERFSFDPDGFTQWADAQGYLDGDVVTIPGALVIQEYIDTCLDGEKVSKKDVQEALIELGASAEQQNINDPMSRVYVWKI